MCVQPPLAVAYVLFNGRLGCKPVFEVVGYFYLKYFMKNNMDMFENKCFKAYLIKFKTEF